MYINKKVVLLFAILMITLGQSVDIYLPSMPSMVIDFHTNASMVQLSITIALIAYGCAALVYGPLSDYFGRRLVALVGLGIFASGGMVCLLAPNIYFFLFGRILQGLGFASACGVSAPALNDVYEGSDLVKAYSYVGMALAIMPVVAPVIGGYFQHYFSWRASFIFLFSYSVVIFLLFFNYFPETNKIIKQGSLHPSVIAKNYLSLLGSAKYIGIIFGLIFVFSGEIYYVVTAPFLLQKKLGITPVQNGWLVLITVSGYLLGTFGSARLCKKFSIKKLLALGCAFSILGGLIMLFFALQGKMTVLTIVAPMMCYMVGAGLIYPNAIGACMSCFPEKGGAACALAASLNQGLGGVGATLATHMGVVNQLPLAGFLLLFSGLTFFLLYGLYIRST